MVNGLNHIKAAALSINEDFKYRLHVDNSYFFTNVDLKLCKCSFETFYNLYISTSYLSFNKPLVFLFYDSNDIHLFCGYSIVSVFENLDFI